MIARTVGVVAALLLGACKQSGSDTTGEATSSTGEMATTGSTGGSPTGSGSAASDSTSSDSSSGAVTSTGVVTTTGTTGDPTDGPTSTGNVSSTDPTGYHGPHVCGIPAGDYGECDTPLGWAFDGKQCTLRTGCDCEPDCAMFHEDDVYCARACGEDGYCNPERIQGYGLAQDPIEQGDVCDRLVKCSVTFEIGGLIDAFFGSEQQCSDALPPCGDDGMCKLNFFPGELTETVWTKLCSLSLLEPIDVLWCIVDP